MTATLVTVSVISHGHGNDIFLLLEDMALLSAGSVAKVIVTLNVPEESLVSAITSRCWPFVVETISNTVPLGFGANHNQAFASCQTQYFSVVNPDIRLQCDPYPALLEALQAPAAGCAYPMQSNGRGAPRDLVREIPTPLALVRRHLLPGYRGKVQQSRDWVNGSFMLFPSRIYAMLKGFDQRFFMYCEDVEICLRLQQCGFRLAPAHEAQVLHRAGHASRRQLRHLSWHLASLLRLWSMKSYRAYRSAKGGLTPQP